MMLNLSIVLFFVEGKYHHQGIGKQLLQMVRTDKMTVNSSPCTAISLIIPYIYIIVLKRQP